LLQRYLEKLFLLLLVAVALITKQQGLYILAAVAAAQSLLAILLGRV
jgi:hypothetical protein